MSDLIIEGAKGIPDGLYVIKDGEFFKYKLNGGSVRSYHVTERPKGHWKMYDIYDFKGRISGERAIICDRCLMKEIIRFGQSKWNFCPNCGADMREEWR